MSIDVAKITRAVVDFSDFEEVDSVSRAKSFITAAKRYLIVAPSMMGKEGQTMQMAHSEVSKLLQRAQSYVSAKDTTSSDTARVRFASFERDFR